MAAAVVSLREPNTRYYLNKGQSERTNELPLIVKAVSQQPTPRTKSNLLHSRRARCERLIKSRSTLMILIVRLFVKTKQRKRTRHRHNDGHVKQRLSYP